MKQLLFCLLIITFLSCNSSPKQQDNNAAPAEETTAGQGNGEMKDGISDYTNNKKSFMLTCHIDASNALEGKTDAQVTDFCECAWNKTKGKYQGEVVANDSKLAKDPILKGCYEAAMK